MATRPFYVEAFIDGKATKLAGGPKMKLGGQDVRIFQRSNGGIFTAFQIVSSSYEEDGKLLLRSVVYDKEGMEIAREVTEY